MIVPDLAALVAEEEEKHTLIPKDMLRSFLRIYHTRYSHVAWFTPAALRAHCSDAAVDSAENTGTMRHDLITNINHLWALLCNRYAQDHPGAGPPYSTEVICGYVQEMIDAYS